MLFVAVCTDKPGALERRLAVRPKHLEWVAAQGAAIAQAGPMMDASGQTVGSIFFYEGGSREAVEARMAQDPYMQAGIFESVILRQFRWVMQGGRQVGA
jgi:hypothetical protein